MLNAAGSRFDELRETSLAWLQGVPWATRSVGGLLVLVSVARWIFGEKFFPVTLSLEALLRPNLRLWTWVTTGLYESSFLYLVMSLAVFCITARFLERIWGSWRFVEFLIVTLCGSYVLLSAIVCLMVVMSANRPFYVALKLHGMTPFIAATTIAYKQLMPENDFTLVHGVGLRLKFLPQLTLALLIIYCVILGSMVPLAQASVGMTLAWLHLRFIQKRDSGMRGDLSDEFSLESFLPELFQ